MEQLCLHIEAAEALASWRWCPGQLRRFLQEVKVLCNTPEHCIIINLLLLNKVLMFLFLWSNMKVELTF